MGSCSERRSKPRVNSALCHACARGPCEACWLKLKQNHYFMHAYLDTKDAFRIKYKEFHSIMRKPFNACHNYPGTPAFARCATSGVKSCVESHENLSHEHLRVCIPIHLNAHSEAFVWQAEVMRARCLLDTLTWITRLDYEGLERFSQLPGSAVQLLFSLS